MAQVYSTSSADASLFAAADAQYARIKEELVCSGFREKPEAEIERWLAVEQRALMRCLLQSHVTLRGEEQAVGPVIGEDGVERTHVRPGRVRHLETVFGTVEVARTAHAGRGQSALYPVDARLNLPEHRYSLEVARQVAQGAARLSYDATLGLLQSMTGARVPKRQAEELVRRAAEDFDDFYATTTLDPQAPTGPLLLLSLDQKGVVLLPEDLHPRTQKAAAEAPRKLETRWCKGEAARGRKRMAMVAAVYTVAPHVRSPTEVIAGLRHVRPADPSPRPRPEYKRVWASLSRSPQDVIHDAFTEAETRDPHHQKQWIVLVDGDNKLTRWVQAEAQRRGISVTLVLDFIHALEYLWRAAHVFHDEGTKEGEAFVLERLERMLEGKTSHVVAGLRRMATQRGLSPAARAPVDKAAQYLLKRTAMMRYDTLLATGAPIATGVIEGACRHLINDRLDVTGARWRIRGAEAVLRLRSLLASGDFDDYWRFHEGAEAFRNHESRYADCTVPQLTSTRPGRHLRLVTPVD